MDIENATVTSEDDCFYLTTSDSIPKPYNVLFTIALSIIVLYGGISNILVLYGSIKTTVRNNSTQKLFLVLSVSNLWTAMIALPIQIYAVNLERKINCLANLIQVFTANHTSWNSGLIVFVISLTRHITVTTNRLTEFVNKKRLALAVLLNFLLAMALAFWQAFSLYHKLSISVSFYYFVAGSFALVLLTSAIVLNFRLISFLQKIRETSVIGNSQYQIKVAKTLLIISITTFVCYAPMIIGYMVSGYLYLYDVDKRVISQTINSWSHVIVYLDCGVGPTIYIISNGLVFRLWKNLFKKKRLANETPDQDLK